MIDLPLAQKLHGLAKRYCWALVVVAVVSGLLTYLLPSANPFSYALAVVTMAAMLLAMVALLARLFFYCLVGYRSGRITLLSEWHSDDSEVVGAKARAAAMAGMIVAVAGAAAVLVVAVVVLLG